MILKYYKPENVIFVKIPVAKYYIKNNEKCYFEETNTDISFEPLLRTLENYVIQKLPYKNIIEAKNEPIAAPDILGDVAPLHFTVETYKDLASQIDDIVQKKSK